MTTLQNFQQSPYLREQRQYPAGDVKELANQSDHAYIDIAQKVNARTIGLYALNAQIITGEAWFLLGSSQRQQTLRQVYTFTAAGNIAHNINISTVSRFTRIYGTFTNGTTNYPLPYVDVVAANNQVNVVVNATNIVITSGAGAPPAITSGLVVLEWLSQF